MLWLDSDDDHEQLMVNEEADDPHDDAIAEEDMDDLYSSDDSE